MTKKDLNEVQTLFFVGNWDFIRFIGGHCLYIFVQASSLSLKSNIELFSQGGECGGPVCVWRGADDEETDRQAQPQADGGGAGEPPAAAEGNGRTETDDSLCLYTMLLL